MVADHLTCNKVADDPVRGFCLSFPVSFYQFYNQGRNIGIIVSLKDLNLNFLLMT